MPHAQIKRHRHRRPRSKSAPGAQSPEPGAATAEPEARPATPQEACARAQQIIVRNWPGIIQSQVDKALDGSHQHAKFLSDQAGLSPALASTAGGGDESLAARLLKHLEIEPADDLVVGQFEDERP